MLFFLAAIPIFLFIWFLTYKLVVSYFVRKDGEITESKKKLIGGILLVLILFPLLSYLENSYL